MKLKIFINILLVLLFVFLVETFSYCSVFAPESNIFPDYNKFKKLEAEFIIDNHLYTNYKYPLPDEPIFFNNDGRSFVGREYMGAPIILLGDSYTYGLGLEKEQSFGFQLSEYIQRPVYNWGWNTEGIEYSLLVLKNNKKFIEKLKQNPPEYVIFTYTYVQPHRVLHNHRLYRWYWLRQMSLLKNQKHTIFDNLYTVLLIKNILYKKYLLSTDVESKLFDYISTLLLQINKEIKKNFKQTKFVILIYSDSEKVIKQNKLEIASIETKIMDNRERWKSFQKENVDLDVIVISTEELLGFKMEDPKYILENERTITIHPSGLAWKEIVPRLAKTLNISG